MQPASLTGRQQQLGLLMGRQPDVLEAARVAALLNGQSGSFSLQSGLGGAGLGSGVLSGLGGTSAGLNLSLGPLPQASQQAPQSSQLALPDQLALLSQFPHALLPPQQYSSAADRDLQLGGLRNVGKTRSSDSRSSSAYASRHQAAEQRRRTRINERLELLRKLVPHAERANTACFLEEVIKYIEALKRRTLELEVMLESGKPVAKSLGPQGVTSGEPAAGSPRQPGAPSGSQQHPHPPSGTAATAAASPSLLAPPAPPSLSAQQAAQQQQQGAQQHQQQTMDSLPAGGAGSAASQQHHSPQLQLAPNQLAHLLPGAGGPTAGGQQGSLGALFPHSGGALSLTAGGSLSLGGGGGALSLAQLTAGLQQAHQQHVHNLGGAGGLLSHAQGHHHLASSHAAAVTQQQINDLQSLQVMHSLQQHHHQQQQQHHARAAAAAAAAAAAGGHHHHHHPPTFHPTNNKAFLHFNEDLFGSLKPELLPSRSLLGNATTSTTPSTSHQLTSAHLPTDSNTLLQVETTRKALSGSPVSSEESGVPLKKRKVLLL